jgi:hypothetical protein
MTTRPQRVIPKDAAEAFQLAQATLNKTSILVQHARNFLSRYRTNIYTDLYYLIDDYWYYESFGFKLQEKQKAKL